MSEARQRKWSWPGHHRTAKVWWILLALLVIVVLYPVTFRFLRVFTVAAGAMLWLGAADLVWPRRPGVAAAILLAGVLGAVWVCLPGRSPAVDPLREAYRNALLRYDGTRYLWGGENRLGIDCSGLVRKAMIAASVRTSLQTANPRLLRTAFDIWWHDCSAKALRDEYRGFTVRRFQAGSINAIAEGTLTPGDLDDVHVLAYLGDHTWIEADPGINRVVQVQTPADNPWFAVPVQIIRWRELDPFP